jgi:hypothetical protein
MFPPALGRLLAHAPPAGSSEPFAAYVIVHPYILLGCRFSIARICTDCLSGLVGRGPCPGWKRMTTDNCFAVGVCAAVA